MALQNKLKSPSLYIIWLVLCMLVKNLKGDHIPLNFQIPIEMYKNITSSTLLKVKGLTAYSLSNFAATGPGLNGWLDYFQNIRSGLNIELVNLNNTGNIIDVEEHSMDRLMNIHSIVHKDLSNDNSSIYFYVPQNEGIDYLLSSENNSTTDNMVIDFLLDTSKLSDMIVTHDRNTLIHDGSELLINDRKKNRDMIHASNKLKFGSFIKGRTISATMTATDVSYTWRRNYKCDMTYSRDFQGLWCTGANNVGFPPGRKITIAHCLAGCRGSTGWAIVFNPNGPTCYCKFGDTYCMKDIWPNLFLNNNLHAQDCTTCQYSLWTEWTNCTSSCNGLSERSRVLLAHDREGCDTLSEVVACKETFPCSWCNLSGWSEWSTCSATCDGGYVTRTRSIIDEGKECYLTNSSYPLSEVKACFLQPCYCNETLIGPHSMFYHGCQNKTRGGLDCINWNDIPVPKIQEEIKLDNSLIGNHNYCRNPITNSSEISTIWCYVDKDTLNPQFCDPVPQGCVLSEWTVWTSCSASCNAGTLTRYREILGYPTNGGQPCPPEEDLKEVVNCVMPNICSVDCVQADWTDWTNCNTTCGTGEKNRNRQVQVSPEGNGKICGPANEMQICNLDLCPSFWDKYKLWIILFGGLAVLLISVIFYFLSPQFRPATNDIYGDALYGDVDDMGDALDPINIPFPEEAGAINLDDNTWR